MDIHLERQGLELGRDLLESQAGAQADVHVRDGRRIEQRRRHVVGNHVLAEQEGALLQMGGQVALHGDEHERASVADEALLLQAGADRRRRVAVLDHELDLCRVAGDRGSQ